jgi:hypothetical protein
MVRLAIAFAALLALASPAAADGFYFLEGVGGSHYHGELADHTSATEGIHIRGAIGWRVGNLALEAFVQAELPIGYVTTTESRTRPGPKIDQPGYFGVDFKVIQPLSRHWSMYARGGLSKMIVTDSDYEGRGVQATGGIQIAGKVPALGYLWWPLFFLTDRGPKVHSALWLEASTSYHRLHGSGPTIDARISGWTLGFSVGQDF